MNSRRLALRARRLENEPSPRGNLARLPARLLLGLRGSLGRHLSVRWKLTLWYGLMCAVTLGALGYGMRVALDIQTRASIDTGLKKTADKISSALITTGRPYGRQPARTVFEQYARNVRDVLAENSYLASSPGQYEQVQLTYPVDPVTRQPLDPTRRPHGFCLIGPLTEQACPWGGSGTPSGGWLADPQTLLKVMGTGQAQYAPGYEYGHGNLSQETLRSYLVPITTPELLRRHGVVGVLEVFQAVHTYSDIEHTLNLIVLLGVPLALFIALVVGWWIARAALRPINRISRTVRTIGESQDLSRRVDFVGPMDEVGRLAVTFDHMMDRLEKVFETQKRFVADASHELRTPLTAIRGNADLLRIAPPEERDIAVASIRREAERMSRLVSDLLLLAAADVDEQPLHMQEVDLCDVLSDVYRSALVVAGDKVSVHFDPADSVTVPADADRIKQLVLNLVDNAVKFTPQGGSVLIGLQEEPGGARIDVSDSGIGIPPEEQQAIFERFYRVDTARSKRGSGLGLSISAWIVQAHNGRIEVHSEPGKGSTFTVHLPAGEAVTPQRRQVPG